MAPLTAGAILDRRFRLTVPLGRTAAAGGTGAVWRATELGTGADVAVKVLAAHLAGDTVAEARFRLAVRTITQLTSPEVTRVLDYGEIPQPGGFAVPYVVRELADGRPLAGLLGGVPLPLDEALRVVATAADALAVAHRAGLAHGRIQPGNVIVGPDRVRITDFGLGSLCAGPAGGMLRYQAPELAAGGAPARRPTCTRSACCSPPAWPVRSRPPVRRSARRPGPSRPAWPGCGPPAWLPARGTGPGRRTSRCWSGRRWPRSSAPR